MVFWLIPFLIGLALNVIAYLLMPKPKGPKLAAVKDLESPTSEAGRETPVVFGTMTVKSPNCLWSGEKSKNTYSVKT